jgi:hypothetical protein
MNQVTNGSPNRPEDHLIFTLRGASIWGAPSSTADLTAIVLRRADGVGLPLGRLRVPDDLAATSVLMFKDVSNGRRLWLICAHPTVTVVTVSGARGLFQRRLPINRVAELPGTWAVLEPPTFVRTVRIASLQRGDETIPAAPGPALPLSTRGLPHRTFAYLPAKQPSLPS